MAQSSLEKMFEGLPGSDIILRKVLRRARKEISKIDEDTLAGYLRLMEVLGHAVRTGEDFDRLMAEGPTEQEMASS